MYAITDIQVVPVKPKDGLVAFASVIFGNAFYLGSIGIMTRPHGGYRLAYPTRKLSNTSLNIFHPINKEIAHVIEDAVIKKLEIIMQSTHNN